MEIDFENIDYLRNGNSKQKQVYQVLTQNKILTALQQFNPILVGTIPINIDIENSDLDIICYCKHLPDFIPIATNKFGDKEGFKIKLFSDGGKNSVVVGFKVDGFEIEIFAQDTPTKHQYAYRHMIVEHKILCDRDETFRQKIINLKKQGYKTEPAFAIALGLTGNPYLELLKFEIL